MPTYALYAFSQTGKSKPLARSGVKAGATVHYLNNKLAAGHPGLDRLVFAFSVAPGIIEPLLDETIYADFLGGSEFRKLGRKRKRYRGCCPALVLGDRETQYIGNCRRFDLWQYEAVADGSYLVHCLVERVMNVGDLGLTKVQGCCRIQK